MAAKRSRASNTVVIEILSERRDRLKSISRELLILLSVKSKGNSILGTNQCISSATVAM